MGTPAQTDASATEVSLALAMQTACLVALPPLHVAEQLLQGVYFQCGPLQPEPLQAAHLVLGHDSRHRAHKTACHLVLHEQKHAVLMPMSWFSFGAA